MTQKEYVITVIFVFIAGLIGGFMIGQHLGIAGHSHSEEAHAADHHQ